jgi:cytochrome P450
VFGREVFVVSDPEHCQRILRWNWRNYPRQGLVVKRISQLLGNGLIASNGVFWASQRRMIQPAFARSAVSGFVDLMARVNAELLQAWSDAARRGESVNVTHDVSAMVLKLTLTAIFGDDYAVVAPGFDSLVSESERNLEFAKAFRRSGTIVREVIERRRQSGAIVSDILGRVMESRDRERGEPMPDAQLVREVMTMVVAGHETTAGLLNWLWRLLSRHPEVEAKLWSELDRRPWGEALHMEALPNYVYARRVIDEALRLYPPLWLMTRQALKDDRLGAFLVPAGTEIYISPYLIQRSPEFWEEPETFDPDRMDPDSARDRPELAHCPFGAGPRNCIGELFARVETQIHLITIARCLRLACDDDRPAEINPGMNLLSKRDFIMRPQFRATASAPALRS